MTERVAIYARVSTDEQSEKQTIQNQLTACRAHCLKLGYEVVAVFADEPVSGAVPFDQRPEGKRLLEVAGDGLFNKVVVYCVDRLGRDVVEGAIARKLLQSRGTPLEFVLQSFDGTPEGELAFNIFMSFAQYERGVIRRRTMAGRTRRVASGKYQASTAPFGYDYVTCGQRKCEHPDCGTLKIDPVQARIVETMFGWAREGIGLKAIATRLDEMGVSPPSPKHPARQSNWGWHFSTVYKMLTAGRYAGQATYGGEAMTCPAIISEETFKAAQRALKKRKLDSLRNTKHAYALQHLIWCRTCGSRYTPRTVVDPRVKGPPRAIYHCYQRSRYGPKAGHENVKWRWSAGELEAKVKDAVRQIYDDPDAFTQRVDFLVERLKDEVSVDGQRVALLEHRVDELGQEEIRVVTLARKGYISEEAMLQQLDQVRAERQAVENDLKVVRQAAADVDWVTEAADWFRQVCETVPIRAGFLDETTGEPYEPTAEEWRDLTRAVVGKVWIEADNTLTFEGPLSPTSVLLSSR